MATKLSDIDFSTTTALAIPEGNVIKIAKNGDIVWQMALYTWAKYSVNTSSEYVANQSTTESSLTITNISGKLTVSRSYNFDKQTGVFSFPVTDTNSINFSSYLGASLTSYPYVMDNNILYKVISRTSYTTGLQQTIVLKVYPITAVETTIQEKSDFIENVTATDENVYPENGVHTDGYWYVKVSDTTTT